MSTTRRNHRIEFRTTSDEKQLLARAAACQGIDVASFIRAVVFPRAREVVAEAERVSLSGRAAAQMLELLDTPPEPHDALIAAARRRTRIAWAVVDWREEAASAGDRREHV